MTVIGALIRTELQPHLCINTQIMFPPYPNKDSMAGSHLNQLLLYISQIIIIEDESNPH